MKIHLRILFFLLPVTTALAQPATERPVLRIYEQDRFDRADSTKNVIPNKGIAEINSTLLLRFDKAEIARRIGQAAGLPDEQWQIVHFYRQVLETQQEMLELLQEGLTVSRSGAEPDMQKAQQLARKLDGFYEAVLDNPALVEEAGKAYAEFDEKSAANRAFAETHTSETYLIEYFSRRAAEVMRQTTVAADSIRFVLAGAIRNQRGEGKRPIHLGSTFDENPVQNYVVPRWSFTLSPEQQLEVRQMGDMVQKVDALRAKSAKDLKEALANAADSRVCFDSIRRTLDLLPQKVTALGEGFKTRMENLVAQQKDRLLGVERKYGQMQEGVASLNRPGLLLDFASDLGGLKTSLEGFFTGLPRELENIGDSTLLNSPEVTGIRNLYHDCYDRVNRDYGKIAAFVATLKEAFSGNNEPLNSVITQETKRLALADIPAESLVELTEAGERSNGDQVVIEAFLQHKSEEPRRIFRQVFSVQQISLYSEVKVNLILANPIQEWTPTDRDFFFAPSYSVLFRWGSRKSRFYNDFLNVGFGGNFSSPDFNLDGVPEFAAAFTVAAFKDFLSAGYGYNFGRDETFWFVGFRVPFASAALPILNEVEKGP